MKKKCMAVGGAAKKPATMEEQLAALRGKVRPGYQAGGIAGIDFDYPLALARQSQNRPPLGSGLGATAIQSGEAPVNAPGSTPQSLGLLGAPDYSTGPKQGGFVYDDGTPRTSQDGNGDTQSAKRGPLSGQIDMGQAMAGLSNTERYKLGGSGTSAEVSEINQRNDILKTLNASLQPTQQIQVGRSPRPGITGGIEEQLIKRGRNGFRDGGIIDKLIRTVGRVLPESNGEKYEPGIQSRAAEDPARHGRAEALNPRTQTASPESPPAGGFQEEAERRRKQMKEAMNYEAGGMVRFSGKGGPRDDQIPVKVAGQEINVSNGENAVILPAKTAANPAALYAIGGIIQATNDGRKPKMGMDKGGKYASGSMPNDEWMPEGGYLRTPEGRQRVAEAIVNAPSIGGNVSFGGQQPATAQSIYAPATDALKKGLSGEGMRPDVGIIGPRAAPVAQEQSPIVARNIEVMNSGAGAGRIDLPITPAQKQAAIANTAAARQAQGITAGVAQAPGAAVNDGMTTTQMGRGFDPTKLQMADGYGMATNAAGKTIAAGNAEYVGADGKPTSRWTDTQQYKDAIARNEADKLRLAEMQARRLGADPMAVQKASQGISHAVMQAPLDARMKQQQIQQGDIAAQNANELRALYEAHKTAKTPEERGAYEEAIRVRTGKDNKLLAVDLGSDSVTDAMGNVKAIPRGQAVIDQSTKQRIPLAGTGQQQTGQQAEGIKAQLAAGKISREKAIEELRKIGFQ